MSVLGNTTKDVVNSLSLRGGALNHHLSNRPLITVSWDLSYWEMHDLCGSLDCFSLLFCDNSGKKGWTHYNMFWFLISKKKSAHISIMFAYLGQSHVDKIAKY